MNCIQALQLALSKPGTKVRPKGSPYWYEMQGSIAFCFDSCGVLAVGLNAGDIINSDGTPVQWEVAE